MWSFIRHGVEVICIIKFQYCFFIILKWKHHSCCLSSIIYSCYMSHMIYDISYVTYVYLRFLWVFLWGEFIIFGDNGRPLIVAIPFLVVARCSVFLLFLFFLLYSLLFDFVNHKECPTLISNWNNLIGCVTQLVSKVGKCESTLTRSKEFHLDTFTMTQYDQEPLV